MSAPRSPPPPHLWEENGYMNVNEYPSATFNARAEAKASEFSVDTYCSVCPAGQFKSALINVENDETSCEFCEIGKCSAPDSDSCSACAPLPNGNGGWDRIGFFGGVIDDITGSDPTKKANAIQLYGPIVSRFQAEWIFLICCHSCPF